ncbi:hypothetical protein [Calycomorphotria hydatis]|uniref:Uncharacterized protein n=1 Tax=Calycomorphotria hydatis TaxID=2528027 RepID=A0A517T3F9_9PLAN|nr:hypothetical protein [Calycomorphotria hydatis]QDT62899.1 hypothetical protein V22_00970 [Calycomorphotria hydatis]
MALIQITKWIGLPLLTMAFLMSAESASAQVVRPLAPTQPIPPNKQPVTSPYLNLLRPGRGGVTFEYFRRVRPELEFRRADQMFQGEISNLRTQVSADRVLPQRREIPLGTTGHPTSFLNTSGYFGGR